MASSLQQAIPPIRTYHCVCCSSLLLATTHTLSHLPVRQHSDKASQAIILPVIAPSSSQDAEEEDEDEDAEMTEDGVAVSQPKATTRTPALSNLGCTLLLSVTKDSRPTIIRREDGFEKRYLHRCGRCRLVVGYELDASHFSETTRDAVKILYVLPGGMMSTEIMGKKIEETEVDLGEKSIVGSWE